MINSILHNLGEMVFSLLLGLLFFMSCFGIYIIILESREMYKKLRKLLKRGSK